MGACVTRVKVNQLQLETFLSPLCNAVCTKCWLICRVVPLLYRVFRRFLTLLHDHADKLYKKMGTLTIMIVPSSRRWSFHLTTLTAIWKIIVIGFECDDIAASLNRKSISFTDYTETICFCRVQQESLTFSAESTVECWFMDRSHWGGVIDG